MEDIRNWVRKCNNCRYVGAQTNNKDSKKKCRHCKTGDLEILTRSK